MGGSELGEVISQREAQAGAVEAFGDALAAGDGHGDGGFRREAEGTAINCPDGHKSSPTMLHLVS